MRYAVALALLILAGCVGAHPRDIEANTLRLDFEGGAICSGTAVARNIVLTADHCLAGGRLLKINGQEAYALKIVRDGKDHALLRVTQQFKTWARMGPSPQTGDRVRWIGSPAGLDSVYREGYVARAKEDELLLDAHGFSGDSGAGLFDDRNRLVAVMSSGWLYLAKTGHHMQILSALPLKFTDEQWASIR